MHTPPRIAIVGGGPGGLMLARILHVHGIASSVYEGDAHALHRPQGGTLDLHQDSGLLAMEAAGLADVFQRVARYDDQGSRLLDKTGRVVFEDAEAADRTRPEIDRTMLRQLLLEALPAECVRWGSVMRELRAEPDGRWTVVLDSGCAGPFDLVVGADGAWSRVRPLLSRYKPQYSGLTFVEFGIDDIDRRHPALARLVGRGKLSVEGDGKEIIAQRNANAHVRGYAIFRVPQDWTASRFDFSSAAAVRAGLISEFEGFAEEILDLFRASTDHFGTRPICALPVGHHWPNRRGLTLLGDAAHVMSPFGGEGVNAAMLDALALARRLTDNADWAAAVVEYETQMFVRVIDAAEGAAEAAATQLSHDGLALTLEMHRRHLVEPNDLPDIS